MSDTTTETPAEVILAGYRPNANAAEAQAQLDRYSVAHLFGFDDVARNLGRPLGRGPLLEALAKVPAKDLVPLLSADAREMFLEYLAVEVETFTFYAVTTDEECERDHDQLWHMHKCILELS